jgi:TnpA family transposase
MAAIYETAYPRLKSNLSYKELTELFTPTTEERALLELKTKKTLPVTRLGFMIILKCYQYLGRPIKLEKAGSQIITYLAMQLGVDLSIDLTNYSKLTRKRHIKIIREYLKINNDQEERKKIMKAAAIEAATKKENLADIVNIIIEELIKNTFELPTFSKLIKLAKAARIVVNNNNFTEIYNKLSIEQKKLIDRILELEKPEDPNNEYLSWLDLKQEPKKPTYKNIKEFINYINQLRNLWQKINIDLGFIPYARLEQLRDEAMIADLDDMQCMKATKRYALAVILIYIKSGSAVDDLVQVFILWNRQIETQAKNNLEQYRLDQAAKVDDLIGVLYQILLAVKNNTTAQDQVRDIYATLGGETDQFIEQCKKYLGLTGENHIVWMKKPYNNRRHVVFQLLDNLAIFSSTQDKSIENALIFIKHHHHSTKEWIELNTTPIQPDLSLLSAGWYKAVTGVDPGVPVNKIHRQYYEIAVCSVLKNDLTCSDAYVDGAFVYDDPNKQFITWKEFHTGVDGYCDLIKLPKDPAKFVNYLQIRLKDTAKKVDDNYPNNDYLTIEEGFPILKKTPKRKDPPNLEKIKHMVMKEMPVISIVDAIIEVENWLNLSVHFKPISGYEHKLENYPSRFVATSFAYGCNVGPKQAERSILKFSRKQIALLFNHHVTEPRLIKVLHIVINTFNLLDLPKHWGTNDSASVDGSFCDMYEQNLIAAHHIRYGRYGGVGYYMISGKYIALHFNFISCGVHESIYLLDGIGENDSDIKPTKIHGDSWAQSEVLFGFSMLLAIAIMPRIKNFKHLYFYKASIDEQYANINELFTEKALDWELVETHYHDMLRVVMSVFKGKVKASTILRKLCSKSRKNKLYFAFRELGRIERTIFLLNYINDPELRKIIQAATCKSEEFNQFIKWIRFGDGGVIGDNLRFNQQKVLKFSQLVANILCLHTTSYQTKAINKLKEQGEDIPDEILARFSPYWTEHLNRLGIFDVNMDKEVVPIEYDLKTPSKPKKS